MSVVTLCLEAIGDDLAAMVRANRRHPDRIHTLPVRYWKHVYSGIRQPWVAEITGIRPSGRFEHRFLSGKKDYSRANSAGSRGVYCFFHLWPDRIYEVNELLSWTRHRRYFCRVEEGRIIELSEREVRACLS
jgi:hypothetical protein